MKYLIISLLLGVILNRLYRPYIFDQKISDFGLAGSGPGFFSFLVVFFMFRILKPQMNKKDLLKIILSFYMIQELFSVFSSVGTFDFVDIVYYFLAYVFLYYFFVKIPSLNLKLM